jgi:hypothetical protein
VIDIKTAASEYFQIEAELENGAAESMLATNSPYRHTLHFTNFAHFNELVC